MSEGAWAREYRMGRVEQVKQQRIANLIAFAALDGLTKQTRSRAVVAAYAELFPASPLEGQNMNQTTNHEIER